MRKTSPGTTALRALGWLARTFPAQIEELNRYRSHGEPAVTVQNVSVGDRGKAIVGNVTQHASVMCRTRTRPPQRGSRRSLRAPGEGAIPPMPSGKRSHERSHQKYRPDAGEPALWSQNPLRRHVPLAGDARQKRCRMHGGAPESGAPRANQNARKHGLFTRDAIAERGRVQALLGEARNLLEEMK